MSIRTKVLVFVLGIIFILGTSGLLVVRHIASGALEDQAKDDLSAIAYSRAEAIKNQLDYQRASVDTLVALVSSYYSADDGFLRSGAVDEQYWPGHFDLITDMMVGMVEANPYVWQALWVDADGNVITSSYQRYKPNDASQTDDETFDYENIDWNEIDLAQVNWSKVDFSKIDVSKIDVSKIEYGKIDWSQISPDDMGALDYSQVDLSQVDWNRVDLSSVGSFDDDVSSQEFFIRGKEGLWIGNAAIYDGSTQFNMVTSAPFYSGDKFAGVMAYIGGEDQLVGVITNHTGLGETGEVYMVNGDGYMLTPSRFASDVVLRQKVELPQILAEVEVSETVTRTNYMGDKVFGVQYELPDTGWTVVVEKSRSEVLGPISDLTRMILWATLVLLVVWVILGIFFARAISEPIVRLKRGAEQIMQGNWDVDVSTSARDEVGDLSRAFSAMTADLRKSQQELQHYSLDLEGKIVLLEQTESALRESEQRYRYLAENVTDVIWTMDMDLKFTYVSSAVTRLMGYSVEEALALSLEELVAPELLKLVHELFQQMLQDESSDGEDVSRTREIELKQYRKDGSVIWSQSHIRFIRGDSGKPVGIIGVSRDITERQQSEMALRESEEKYRALVDSSIDAVISIDSQMKIVVWNQGAQRIFGHAPEEMLGQSLMRIVPERYHQAKGEGFFQFAETGSGPLVGRMVEITGLRKDGTEFPLELSLSGSKQNGGYVATAFARDVTERKESEEKILASLREKDVMLKEIHHRVKNNLQVISSLLNLQKDSIADRRSQELFDESGRRVRSMALIHEQLYGAADLSRIDFTQYVRELAGRLVYSCGQGAGNVKVDIEGEDIFLDIDKAVPCGLIINEIITNSFKYAFPPEWAAGGDISRININLTAGVDGRISILVKDNGIGLPSDFDYRHSDTLGLQIVHSLIDQLGATMKLQCNGGTGFSITIP